MYSGMWPTIPPITVAGPDPESQPIPMAQRRPFACIKASGGYTFCNRLTDEKEFYFQDGWRAVDFYDGRVKGNASPPFACVTCVDAFRSKRERPMHLKPMVNR